MKSIKEKAIEFAKENINSLGFISQEHVDGYVAGANYVLECIEDIIANNEDNTLNMARCLVDCIEQLKK